ncbi:MAG TPA: PAS domain-containing protein, partial [Thermoanaerobaculia bacterium]
MSEPLVPLLESAKPRVPTVLPLVAEIKNFAQDVFDTVREPLLVLDADLRVRLANTAFYKTFQVTAAETESRHVYELGTGQWGLTSLRTLLEEIIPESSVFNDFTLEHDFPHIGRRIMLLNARKLHAELVLLAMEDVT